MNTNQQPFSIFAIPTTRNVVVMYHSPCVDGMSSYYVVWSYLTKILGMDESRIQAFPTEHNRDFAPEFNSGVFSNKTLFVLDIVFAEPVMTRLAQDSAQMFVVDHHPGAAALVRNQVLVELIHSKGGVCLVDASKKDSGATLTWKLLFRDLPIPEPLQVVNARDNFFHQDSGRVENLAAYIYSVGSFRSLESLDGLVHSTAEELNSFAEIGQVYNQANKNMVRSVLAPANIFPAEYTAKAPVRKTAGDPMPAETKIPCAVVVANGGLISDVGDVLTREHPEYLFAVVARYDLVKNVWYLSLRSKYSVSEFPNAVNVTDVANQLGGGGHFQASGATLNGADSLRTTFVPR